MVCGARLCAVIGLDSGAECAGRVTLEDGFRYLVVWHLARPSRLVSSSGLRLPVESIEQIFAEGHVSCAWVSVCGKAKAVYDQCTVGRAAPGPRTAPLFARTAQGPHRVEGREYMAPRIFYFGSILFSESQGRPEAEPSEGRTVYCPACGLVPRLLAAEQFKAPLHATSQAPQSSRRSCRGSPPCQCCFARSPTPALRSHRARGS